jgi:hypothetical protein
MLGITEEATAFGVPSLVLRLTTDRPEGVLAGASRIIGSDKVWKICFWLFGGAYDIQLFGQNCLSLDFTFFGTKCALLLTVSYSSEVHIFQAAHECSHSEWKLSQTTLL